MLSADDDLMWQRCLDAVRERLDPANKDLFLGDVSFGEDYGALAIGMDALALRGKSIPIDLLSWLDAYIGDASDTGADYTFRRAINAMKAKADAVA
ncbi:MAG: hypothetical protein Q4G30_07550 [Actinomycetaceae bacterium]|nr:hypothetical protein [Actinomycetaceae bacterium]